MKAADVMSREPVRVCPGHNVHHAARIMLERGISGLPVIDDDNRLVGIITAGDLLRRSELTPLEAPQLPPTASPEERARAYVKSHSWSVGDVMTSPVVTVDEDAPLDRVAMLLDEHHVRRLPVMNEGRLSGIVSRTDLLRRVVEQLPDRTAHGDPAIRRSILARLTEGTGLDITRIDVKVKDGLVKLSGRVGSQSEREAARVVAEGLSGVSGVENELTIDRATARRDKGNGEADR